jgi:hypothetical protein
MADQETSMSAYSIFRYDGQYRSPAILSIDLDHKSRLFHMQVCFGDPN